METNCLIPPDKVIESIFKKYCEVPLSSIHDVSENRAISTKGFVAMSKFDENNSSFNFSESVDSAVGVVSVVYAPRLGISTEKLNKICDLVNKYQLKTDILGEVIPVAKNSKFKQIMLHGMVVEYKGRVKRYPNLEILFGNDKTPPSEYLAMDHWNIELVNKEFGRIRVMFDILGSCYLELTNSQTPELQDLILDFKNPVSSIGEAARVFADGVFSKKISKEKYLQFRKIVEEKFAEFEFYKIFENAYYKLEKNTEFQEDQNTNNSVVLSLEDKIIN